MMFRSNRRLNRTTQKSARPTAARVLTGIASGLALALVATTTLPVVAHAEVSKKSLKLQEKAQRLLEQGKTQAAMIELKNAILADGDNIEARYQLGTLYLKTNEPLAAENEFKVVKLRGYDRGTIDRALAKAYLQQGKNRELLEEFTEILEDPIDQALLYLSRVQAHLAMDDPDSAEVELNKAVKLAPELSRVHFVHSLILSRKGDFEGALAKVDKAISLDKNDAYSHAHKADVHRQLGQFEESVAAATKALDIWPRNTQARLLRGLSYAAKGDYDAAIADADVILEIAESHPTAAYIKSVSLAKQEKTAEALRVIDQAQNVDLIPSARFLLASLNLIEGNLEQARVNVTKFRSKNPDNAAGRALSGNIYLQMGNTEKAIEELEPLLESYPDNAELVSLLANAYASQREFNKAAELFDRSSKLNPDDKDLALNLARTRLGAGEFDKAVEGLETIASGEDGDQRAATMLVLTYLRGGEFDKADETVEKLRKLLPNSPLPDNYAASIDRARGDLKASEAHLKSALDIDPGFHTAALKLAQIYKTMGRLEDSKDVYRKILAMDSANTMALVGAANVAFDAGASEEAIELLEKALAADPKAEAAHLKRVNILLILSLNDKALVASREFLQELPESPAAFDTLARAQLANGDHASAILTYVKLSKLLPRDERVYERIAATALDAGNQERAKEALDNAIRINPAKELNIFKRVELELKLSGKMKAVSLARSLFGRITDPVSGQLGLGHALIRLGESEEGIAIIEKVHQENKKAKSVYALNRAYAMTGQLDKAQDLLAIWVDENEEDNLARLAYMSVLIQTKNYGEARVLGDLLVSREPDNIILLNNLAWVYSELGEGEPAIEMARRAYKLSEQSAEVADTLGWILIHHGHVSEGSTLLSQATVRMPARADIRYHYAVALSKLGRNGEARQILEKLLLADPDFTEREDAEELLKTLSGN